LKPAIMADLQDRIQVALDELVASGAETGLQAAVYAHGRLIADAVSGQADAAAGTAVTSGTLFFAVSAAKGVAATLAHVLAERGELDYDLHLASVWPGFASAGKDRITIRHVLGHTAGLPGLPAGTTVAQLCDWEHMCAVLAAATPWWEPGTKFGYHALTFGFLLGETLRRLTGRTISELLRDTVTDPLGVADEVCFAIPPRLLPRMARRPPHAPEPEQPPPGSPADRATPPALRDPSAFTNRDDVLTADIPSLGTMTARGAARMYAALLGPVDGVRLVSPSRLAAMSAICFTGPDEVMGFRTQWAFGYSPARPGGVTTRPGASFGMIGANGSAAWADADAGVAVAVMRNGAAPGDLTAAGRVDRLVAGQPEPEQEER
jgi:CubicO group peptidase (beta-lactamase class C family)